VSRKLRCELLSNNLGSICPLFNMDKWPFKKKQFQKAISRDKLLLEPVDRIPTEEVLGNYFPL